MQDKEIMMSLMNSKVSDINYNSIFKLYRKYIDNSVSTYSICRSCDNSIYEMYSKLKIKFLKTN